MVFLLLVIGLFLFLFHGLGFLIFNMALLGLLEVLGMLFTGMIGFVIVGLVISWALVSIHKH